MSKSLTVQVQSGNPVNIVTSYGTINGVANTLRPDVTGLIQIVGESGTSRQMQFALKLLI